MAIFIISYDLVDQKNYPKVIKALEESGAHRALRSVWLANFDSSIAQVLKWMRDLTDDDDMLIVSEVKPKDIKLYKPYQGTYAWIEKNS